MAGLCNTLCITEFNPSIYMMYNKDEIPSFKNKEECLNIINDFLNFMQDFIEFRVAMQL